VFSYKAAVAAKKYGYKNIRIYNGGLKDWKKSGFAVVSDEGLPNYKGKFLTAEELLSEISAVKNTCINAEGRTRITLIDLRTEHQLKDTKRPSIIKCDCPIIYCLLDDLQNVAIRRLIPKDGLVVTITETGNRDKFAMQYLYKHGYGNIKGLLFGMRGWIKPGYQTETP